MKKILFVLHPFDPINKNIFKIIEYAEKSLNIENVFLIHDNIDYGHHIFSAEEKMIMINEVLKTNHKTYYHIIKPSFNKKNYLFFHHIFELKDKYPEESIFWLLTSDQFKVFKEYPNFKKLTTIVNVVYFALLNDSDELFDHRLTTNRITYLQHSEKIEKSNDSIYEMNENSFEKTILNYINLSVECGIKRIKTLEKPERFQHSLRVASTIDNICQILEIEDHVFTHKAYISAIYHDICKNFPINEQIQIAKEELKIIEFPSWKVLHGPIGAWYLKNKYLYDDEEVLTAIKEHTIPSEKPSLLTKLLYLADHLELKKKNDFTEEEYENFWSLIQQKNTDEAFKKMLNKSWNTHKK